MFQRGLPSQCYPVHSYYRSITGQQSLKKSDDGKKRRNELLPSKRMTSKNDLQATTEPNGSSVCSGKSHDWPVDRAEGAILAYCLFIQNKPWLGGRSECSSNEMEKTNMEAKQDEMKKKAFFSHFSLTHFY